MVDSKRKERKKKERERKRIKIRSCRSSSHFCDFIVRNSMNLSLQSSIIYKELLFPIVTVKNQSRFDSLNDSILTQFFLLLGFKSHNCLDVSTSNHFYFILQFIKRNVVNSNSDYIVFVCSPLQHSSIGILVEL